MRIAAIVGVKDERDLIGPCLERLWSVGIGPVLVLDDSSTDGTREVVQSKMNSAPAELALVTFDPDFSAQLRFDSTVMRPFLSRNAPDWVLFTDADEFLVCVRNDLRARLESETAAALAVERYNVPFTATPLRPVAGSSPMPFLDAELITSRQALSRALLAEDPGRRWIMHKIAPKLICRPDHVVSFGLGWHTAFDAQGLHVPAVAANGILIVHLPLTTHERFVRKVDSARAFMARWGHLYEGEAAWHWRRWIELADKGLIDAEFENQRMDDAILSDLRAAGAIERAAAVLERHTR